MILEKNELLGKYSAVVWKGFIEYRETKWRKYAMGKFGVDSEFPEHHQASTDPNQMLEKKADWDTNHATLKHLDYKLYSKNGVHISPWIQGRIRKGLIDNLVVWWWIPGYTELREGMPVKYEILGIVDAKKALSKLNKRTNRFTYPL